MRTIVNISLPSKMAEKIKKEVGRGGFASVSEFFRHLFREHEEEKALMAVKKSRKEIREGKGKTLRSFKDLR